MTGDEQPKSFLARVAHEAHAYDDFNLIVGSRDALYYLSSRNGAPQPLAPGIHGISNHLLDTPWPKLTQAKRDFALAVDENPPSIGRLFELLADRSPAADEHLPDTGVGIEWERRLSPIFIVSPDYGTRASTVVLFHDDGAITFRERSYGEEGTFLGDVEEAISP